MALALLACLYLGLLPSAAAAAVQPIDRVVAVVNQEAITERELRNRVDLVERQLREQRRPAPPIDALTRQVLEQMIVARAQAQYARQVGLTPTEAEIDRAVADVAQQNGLSVQQLRERLGEQGVAFATFREQLAGEIITLRLREREAASKVTISEAEVDAQLAKRAAGAPVEYDVAQILLRLPADADQATVASRMQQAEELLARARDGADFGDLARQYSESPEAMQGGRLGWRTAERLPDLFLKAVSNLQPGQVAPVVRSPAGLHVLKLVDRRSEGAAAGGALVQTHARHILLPAGSPEAQAEAARRLEEFKRTIASGADTFESLAQQFSSDGSARNGGDLGWLFPGETVPEFERAMNELPEGGISDPVRTQFGVHLIQVIARRTVENSPEQMRAAARQALRQQKADEAYDEWLREIRDRAYVEYRLDN
jgi:peptidyl-prolyl cis-trans isomerase SurA